MHVLHQNGYVVYTWGSMSFERHLYWQATKKKEHNSDKSSKLIGMWNFCLFWCV